jgi:predicted RNase H-like HicB family nuclease
MSSEIIFEVREDEIDGGYTATALGFGIHTQGETVEEVRAMVKEAVACYFEDEEESPSIIRLHFVRDEVMAR